DEQDTLVQAGAIAMALRGTEHEGSLAPFAPDAAALESLVARKCPGVVFNLVESVWGSGLPISLAGSMLSELGVRFTGAGAASIAACTDKLFSKRLLRAARLPTAAWSEQPLWDGLDAGQWIVKAVSEDASLGLDDGAVVSGRKAVVERAR